MKFFLKLIRFRHQLIVVFVALLSQNFGVGFSGVPIPQNMPEISISQGKAGFGIPIEIPPGKLAPSIGLSYNSSGTNGLLGVGWDISGIEYITRDPSFGVNYNNSDTFISSMGGGLVHVEEEIITLKKKVL